MEIATENPSESARTWSPPRSADVRAFGAPLIVVSFGTATVFIALSAAGAYLGVAIAPGVAVSIDALIGRTAKLPQIAIESPRAAIGRNTHDALQSGIVYGFAGQVEAIVERIRGEMGEPVRWSRPAVWATSSRSNRPSFDCVDPHLSLFGLNLFARDVLGEALGARPFKR